MTGVCNYVAGRYNLFGKFEWVLESWQRTWWVAVRTALAEQSRDSMVALRCLLLGLEELWFTFLSWCMCKRLLIRTHIEPILLVSPQEVI